MSVSTYLSNEWYQPLPATVCIPNPKLDRYMSDLPKPNNSVRSVEVHMKQALRSTKRKAEAFLKFAPVFEVDLDLDSLTTSIVDLKEQEEICDTELGPNQPAQVFSGQWQTRSGNPLAFYLSNRWTDAKEEGVSEYL